jgi:hypothetical protein
MLYGKKDNPVVPTFSIVSKQKAKQSVVAFVSLFCLPRPFTQMAKWLAKVLV